MPDLGRGHVWGALIKRHKEEFEKNPELLALVRDKEGKLVRRGPLVESTDPRIVEMFVGDIRAAFEKNKWPKDKAVASPLNSPPISMASQSAFLSAERMIRSPSGSTESSSRAAA